jgi:hypothetical protein
MELTSLRLVDSEAIGPEPICPVRENPIRWRHDFSRFGRVCVLRVSGPGSTHPLARRSGSEAALAMYAGHFAAGLALKAREPEMNG